VLFSIRQDDRRAAFPSPVDGVVTGVDADLAWHPEMIHNDPYRDGWICSLDPTNLSRDLKQMRSADEARSWLRDEAERVREFFATVSADDDAALYARRRGAGLLEQVDGPTWSRFNEAFLESSRCA
jgi:hypothetical protein